MALVFTPAAGDGSAPLLTVLDYRTIAKSSAPASAAGVATVTFDPVPDGCLWLVERITVVCSSSAATKCMVYAGDPALSTFVDGTASGNFDTADEASPVLVDSNVSLTVQWTGATAGAVGTVRIQYQLVKRS